MDQLPSPLVRLSEIVVPLLQQVYDINAGRFDAEVGDDNSVFGFNVYRNSWFQLEQAFRSEDGWTAHRPEGSLVLKSGQFEVHSYRIGNVETADLDAFQLDDPTASLTKQSIAAANAVQLELQFEDTGDDIAPDYEGLHALVVVHAGNPDDGCCGVWLGAPIATENVVGSPWAWVTPLWLIDRPNPVDAGREDLSTHVGHEQLPEPEITLIAAVDDAPAEREG